MAICAQREMRCRSIPVPKETTVHSSVGIFFQGTGRKVVPKQVRIADLGTVKGPFEGAPEKCGLAL